MRDGIGGRTAVSVSRDLTGGVRIELGLSHFVFSPDMAVQFATAILKHAGVAVEFTNPGQTVVRPPGMGLQS